MSQAQYNLNTKTDYLNRKMFLDPAGPVTIQRFEEVKYKKIADFEATARGFFWQPEEISLSKDSNDFKDASDAIKRSGVTTAKSFLMYPSCHSRRITKKQRLRTEFEAKVRCG